MFRLLLAMIFSFPLLLSAETLVVKTKAPHNKQAEFQYRVPKGYDKSRREMYRVLVIFGGRNSDGKADASGRLGWGKWCDDNGIFLVAPGFKDDDYWEPKSALPYCGEEYRVPLKPGLFKRKADHVILFGNAAEFAPEFPGCKIIYVAPPEFFEP